MSLEAFARATAAAQAGEKVHERFDKMGVRLADFLRASEHFTPRLAKDPALAARFTEMLEKGWKLR